MQARKHLAVSLAVLAIAGTISFLAARDRTLWNDASRLATVECLVDQHTLTIDHSSFWEAAGGDKILVDGHYYSDKAPVSSLLLALVYQVLQWLTGLVAAEQRSTFIWAMTLGSSAISYVVAVWCVLQMTRALRLAASGGLIVTASFALATLAPIYARQVNAHIELLAVAAALLLCITRLSERTAAHAAQLFYLGFLAGLGYTLDLATGPILAILAFGWVVHRFRAGRLAAVFLLGALPWLALHHAVNYAIGGTLAPANTVAEFFRWPGSPFTPQNLTGAWHHPTVGSFIVYTCELLLGERGFLWHNLPLLPATFGLFILLRRGACETPQLLLAGAWAAGTWLAYALTSNNYSGACLSIRWFVPLLAGGYYVLVVLWRDCPGFRPAIVLSTGGGSVLMTLMWSGGTWYRAQAPHLWIVGGVTFLTWLVIESVRRLRLRKTKLAELLSSSPLNVTLVRVQSIPEAYCEPTER